MGTLAANAEGVLILLAGLAALSLAWWGGAIWWTMRRSNWRYGVLAGLVSALLMVLISIILAAMFGDSFWPIAVCWALLPPVCAWGAIKLASRNMVNER